MADWRDAETDDPPPYGVDVWIHREWVNESTDRRTITPVVVGHRALAHPGPEARDEWRSYDGTTYHSVVAWAPIVPPVPPVAPVRVVKWVTP